MFRMEEYQEWPGLGLDNDLPILGHLLLELIVCCRFLSEISVGFQFKNNTIWTKRKLIQTAA